MSRCTCIGEDWRQKRVKSMGFGCKLRRKASQLIFSSGKSFSKMEGYFQRIFSSVVENEAIFTENSKIVENLGETFS